MEIVLYTTNEGNAQFRLQKFDDQIWLSQIEIAELYQTTKQNISKHIKAIFSESELDENSTVNYKLTVQKEGKREIKDSEKDEARHDFVDSYTEGKSFASTRQEVSASGMDFSCAEGNNTEEKYYEAGCFTVYRGRVMNYQRHDSTPRSLEEQKHRTASLAKEVGEALASLPN